MFPVRLHYLLGYPLRGENSEISERVYLLDAVNLSKDSYRYFVIFGGGRQLAVARLVATPSETSHGSMPLQDSMLRFPVTLTCVVASSGFEECSLYCTHASKMSLKKSRQLATGVSVSRPRGL